MPPTPSDRGAMCPFTKRAQASGQRHGRGSPSYLQHWTRDRLSRGCRLGGRPSRSLGQAGERVSVVPRHPRGRRSPGQDVSARTVTRGEELRGPRSRSWRTDDRTARAGSYRDGGLVLVTTGSPPPPWSFWPKFWAPEFTRHWVPLFVIPGQGSLSKAMARHLPLSTPSPNRSSGRPTMYPA